MKKLDGIIRSGMHKVSAPISRARSLCAGLDIMAQRLTMRSSLDMIFRTVKGIDLFLRKNYAELKEKNNPERNFRNLIFVSSTGNFRTSANTRRLLQRFCDECGIEYRGLNALRHTWATRALEAGIDVKKVSVMLGHKNVVTTMNIYQHVLKESQDEVADMMNVFI